MRRIAVATFLVLCALAAVSTAGAPAAVPIGTLSVCNVSGARPITAPLAYTLAAPASAGGTQTISVAVGACSTQIFYPQGTSLIVTEAVPAGFAVTSIAIGGGESTITLTSLASGSATVRIGSGQSVLTFTTSAPVTQPQPRACRVPNVIGLGLTTAKAAIVKASCRVGRVTRAYSAVFNAGRVAATKPRRGTVLAHNAPVDVVVSRGPRR